MATAKNLNGTDPAAPGNARNATWQVVGTPSSTDPTTGNPVFDASCYMLDMVGDAGSGGADGLVPAPAAGDAAANKFLKADGTWALPGGTSVDNEILIVTSGPTIPALAHAPNPASSLKLYWQGGRQQYITDFTVSGTAITPVTFTPSVGDNFIVDYRF
jgi:hypothetical protein